MDAEAFDGLAESARGLEFLSLSPLLEHAPASPGLFFPYDHLQRCLEASPNLLALQIHKSFRSNIGANIRIPIFIQLLESEGNLGEW